MTKPTAADALHRPTLKEGESPIWAIRRAAWEERQQGKEGPWYRLLCRFAEENARWWLNQKMQVRDILDYDPAEHPSASAEWPWAEGQEITEDDIEGLRDRLSRLVGKGAVLRVWDQRQKVLFMEGQPGLIEIQPIRNVPDAAERYEDCPGQVLVRDGLGARITFRFAKRAPGMADPGQVTVDITSVLEDSAERWVGGGLRYRVEIEVKQDSDG